MLALVYTGITVCGPASSVLYRQTRLRNSASLFLSFFMPSTYVRVISIGLVVKEGRKEGLLPSNYFYTFSFILNNSSGIACICVLLLLEICKE